LTDSLKRFCPFCGGPLVSRQWEGRRRLFCPACQKPLYENPVPATCLVVIDAARQVLLVRRSIEPKIGFWCLPGGFLELGESPEAGALRELAEETGLKGAIDSLLGVAVVPNSLYHNVLMIGYRVEKFEGQPRPDDDADAIGWFDGNDLPPIAFDSHLRFIRQALGDDRSDDQVEGGPERPGARFTVRCAGR
jgi:ADP-ribose pyrophosphatase YjhB (NUDIX family)